MFRFLVDTCVWLDIAKDPEAQPLLSVMEQLVQMQSVSLILPRTILGEFQRNKKRVVEDRCRSLSGVFKRVKEAVDKFGDPKNKQSVLQHLNDVAHQIPLLGESAVEAIIRIERLMEGAAVIELTDAVKLRAAQRAIERKAPFHRGKNEIGDAIILETYADCVREKNPKGTRLAFVTHNKDDFSEPHGDKRMPHADIVPLFSRGKSLYFISLKEALSRVNPGLLADIRAEEERTEEPRKLSEILNALDELFDKVWYGRHGLLAHAVESGKTRVVEKDDYPAGKSDPKLIRRDIWEGTRKAARRVEKKCGIDNLGPWDDFEWGMLSGKLSALRWVLGDEWDMLDT
ncbi:MAG: DUF4935 domain-containing protein [Planctomycetes bacterium]|nr:DUF4935 domain-containing protein [Planctomycetota bacterium]